MRRRRARSPRRRRRPARGCRARPTARCRARRSRRAAARARRRRAARCTASGRASGRSASRNVRPRRGFSTATVPSSRSVRKMSSCEPASGPGTSRRSARPPSEQRVRPGLALAGREPRRVLPDLRQRDDRARRGVQAAAGLEERRADHAVVAPDEVVRLGREVLDALVQRQRRRAALDPHAPLERERRERAAHAARRARARRRSARRPSTSHADERDLAVERQLGAAVGAGVVAAREQLLPAAAVVAQELHAVRALARRRARRLQPPGRLEEHVDAGRAVAELVDLAALARAAP